MIPKKYWVKHLYELVDRLNDTEPQMIGMKPKDAIKLKEVKTSFACCSSGSGQNSVILVVCDVPELKLYIQHATLSNCP